MTNISLTLKFQRPFSGMNCGNPLHSNAITSAVGFLGGNHNWLFIGSLIIGAVMFVGISMLCILILARKCQNRPPPDNGKSSVLNSNAQHEMQILKVRSVRVLYTIFSYSILVHCIR